MSEESGGRNFKDLNIRLAVTDLDDTLVRPDKSISDYTRRIFQRCSAQGIRTAFATARLLISTQREQELLKPDIRIVSNGAAAMAGEKLLFFDGIGIKGTNDFLHALLEAGADGLLAGCREHVYTNSRAFETSRTLREAVYHSFGEPLTEEACQIFFRLEDEDALGWLQKAFSGLNWIAYRDGSFAVTAKGVSKAAAVKRAAAFYGIGLNETAAFGDDEGDCEMLGQCGVGVAVGNAVPRVRRAASFVTKSNEEDGVAWFLEQYIQSKCGRSEQ